MLDNTHEWCVDGVTPQIENLQDVPVQAVQWWHDIMTAGGMVNLPDVSSSEVSEDIRDVLQPRGITARLAIPMFVNGKLYGFTGWTKPAGQGNGITMKSHRCRAWSNPSLLRWNVKHERKKGMNWNA
ncbi:hypothetical protein GF324_06400 [bacterium]|nr:hypothetical protein [bacterium]